MAGCHDCVCCWVLLLQPPLISKTQGLAGLCLHQLGVLVLPTPGKYWPGLRSGPAHCYDSGWAAGHGGRGIVPQTGSHHRSLSLPAVTSSEAVLTFLQNASLFALPAMGTGLPPPPERGLPLPVDSTPSLATLLATPLTGVSTSSKTPPLVLSSALPAIPGKVVETIRAGGYIDFKELLPDNMALRRRLMEAGWGTAHSQASNSREIKDVTTWVHCFLSFVAAKVDSEETRQLMAYGQIVLMLATKYGGLGWRLYDAHFRQLVSAGQHLPWAKINPSMMLAH